MEACQYRIACQREVQRIKDCQKEVQRVSTLHHPIVVLCVSSVFSLSMSARTRWAQTSPKSAVRVTTAGKVLISNGRHPEVCGPVGLVRPNGRSFRVLELHQTCRWQCLSCWCFSASTPRVNDRAPSIKWV